MMPAMLSASCMIESEAEASHCGVYSLAISSKAGIMLAMY